MLVGTIALVDLRLLGVALTRHAVSQLASELAPWTKAGLLTVLLTGPLLFWADLGRYVKNPAFVVKMVLLAAALAGHFWLHRSGRKIAVAYSMIVWSAVVLAGRAIADFDIPIR